MAKANAVGSMVGRVLIPPNRVGCVRLCSVRYALIVLFCLVDLSFGDTARIPGLISMPRAAASR